MDMYQKREMRKNKKMNENTKSLPSTSINWLITINLNPFEKYCKIKENSK